MANLLKMRQKCKRITMLSSYDASFPTRCEAAWGVELFLVGDSLGMLQWCRLDTRNHRIAPAANAETHTQN